MAGSLTDYEQERLDRIAANKVRMEGALEASRGLAENTVAPKRSRKTKRATALEENDAPPAEATEEEPARRVSTRARRSTKQETEEPSPVKSKPAKQPKTPPQRSVRAGGDDIEDEEEDEAAKAAEKEALRQAQKEEQLKSLNAFRLQTMSDRALRRRIHSITNIAKMRSFVEVLYQQGKNELAAEAEVALARLLE